MEHGFSVRLCFDPMIYCSDWKNHYDAMLAQVCGTLDLEKLSDVSVGTFRISQDYLKKMRKNEPDSAVVQFPYQNDSGVYHYPTALMEEMEQYMTEKTCRLSSGRADFQMEGIRREYMEQCRENKAAIVTGASSGIGAAISARLCEMGYEVFGIGRSFGSSFAEQFPDAAGNPLFHAVVCDLLDTEKNVEDGAGNRGGSRGDAACQQCRQRILRAARGVKPEEDSGDGAHRSGSADDIKPAAAARV